jgi:DNA-binding beta-propeller fold protein YncE
VHDVVVPINLVTQRALAPIVIPGQGATHAVVLMHNDRTILAASGSTIVPVDAVTHDIGTPLDLGAGRTIFGLALDPVNTTLYALVPGGVVPVDTADASAGTLIPTGLAVSSVYSPHGIAITGNGSTVYVVGQGGVDFGGRVLPIATATGTTLPATGFDRFGISDPAALAVTSDGAQLMVVDSANDWLNPVAVATFATPGQPVLLPQRHGGGADSGTEHPTDIVLGPGRTGAFVVDGFDSVVPYTPGTEAFGRAIPVCTGATSMTVATAP